MANVIINDTNLTNIANAIREKNGTTDTYKPSEMANAIAAIEAGGGGGYVPTDEDLTIYANYMEQNNFIHGYGSPFENGNNTWLMREYGDRITLYTHPYISRVFHKYKDEVFSANIKILSASNFGGGKWSALSEMFAESTSLKEITGSIKPEGENVNFTGYYFMFNGCRNLRVINDNFIDTSNYYWYPMNDSSANLILGAFNGCYSLREVPKFFNGVFKTTDGNNITSYSTYLYTQLFQKCYALNKVEDLPIIHSKNGGGNFTSNGFANTFDYCNHLSKLTFKTNVDGTPIVANWTNQTIDLTKYVGYGNSESYMTGYNSGLIINYRVPFIDGSNGGDFFRNQWYDENSNYFNDRYSLEADSAKYGRTEAVETINSLPDTSAAGGSNIIKFKGAQGKYTDWMKCRTNDTTYDSSINTLTEEEIAVAAAKGWTVTLV